MNREAQGTGPNFFTTVIFELRKDVSLSWILTDEEKADIAAGMKDQNNIEALKSIVAWWKIYGPSNVPPKGKGTSESSVIQQSVE